MSDPRHPIDEIQEALDGRLDAKRRRRVEAHLRSCAPCREEAEQLGWIKGLLRRQDAGPEVPSSLRSAIAAALEGEDRAAARPRAARAGSRSRIAVAASFAAVLALLLLWRFAGPRRELVTALALDYGSHAVAAPPLERRTADAGDLERFFAGQAIGFPARVIDLDMMAYRLVGGRVHRVAGRPGALILYQGPGGRFLLCQMFLGKLSDLGGPPEVREHAGIRFHVHHVGDRTLVSWQEGAVVCVLTSDGPSEEVVSLAFAKAVKA